MAQLDSGTNVDAGGIRLNPPEAYTSRELAAREKREFFDRRPVLLGLSADLPEPGAFLTSDDFRVPILATRDSEGIFHAFVNSCRHRGTRVESRERGTSTAFSCPFHGWTYSSQGELKTVPKGDHFGDVDHAGHGLIELPAIEQLGLLWIHTDPSATIDSGELLTGLEPEFGSWDLPRFDYAGGATYDMQLNWKLAMDTFGETYHFPVLHKDTLAQGFHGNCQAYDTFGRNHRMILCRRGIDEMRLRPEDEWRISEGGLPVYWLFPNVLVRAFPGPDKPGRSISQISFYARPEILGDEKDWITDTLRAFADIIQDEDYAVACTSQASAEAGALPHFVFGRNEPALHHYHNTYRHALGMDLLPLLDSA